jgi:hypothetical protein
MWDRIEHRLALMELVVTGRLRRRKSQEQAWTWLAELPWTRRSGRRDQIVGARPEELLRLLDQAWPEWRRVRTELEAAGLSASEQGWRRLQEIQHSKSTVQLPPSLNRRTAVAQVGPHSKASMSQVRRQALQDVALTHDGIIRLRPSAGLWIQRGGQHLDAQSVAAMLGEVVISERALASGTRFAGTLPSSLLLVENIGPYQDVSVPCSWMVAHVPGWDSRTVRMIFDQLPQVEVIHFGDLDPNGVRIHNHLHSLHPGLRWFVPAFWGEYTERKGLMAEWPADLDVGHAPALVQEIAKSGLWLEQEAIVLDPRLSEALICSSGETAYPEEDEESANVGNCRSVATNAIEAESPMKAIMRPGDSSLGKDDVVHSRAPRVPAD